MSISLSQLVKSPKILSPKLEKYVLERLINNLNAYINQAGLDKIKVELMYDHIKIEPKADSPILRINSVDLERMSDIEKTTQIENYVEMDIAKSDKLLEAQIQELKQYTHNYLPQIIKDSLSEFTSMT